MNFISSIHIHDLYHLKDLKIEFDPTKTPHLLLTGRNGSGKTVLLRAIAEMLYGFTQKPVKTEERLKHEVEAYSYMEPQQILELTILDPETTHNSLRQDLKQFYGAVRLGVQPVSIYSAYREGNFVFAYYPARRTPNFEEPQSPKKPDIQTKAVLGDRVTSQFLNFLSDLKIQGALAQNEGQEDDANHIKVWFENFKEILRRIFQDDKLELEFDYRNYAFHIVSEGKRFKFTELSDGFAAILDIVADLILKMQREGESVSQSFRKEGIVLIDEVETHLHLSLQKEVMPFLTTLFPKIQFIVTTHSPFVLNSLENAVAYDLEHREVVSELNEYSAESITAGYFDVRSASAYSEIQLQKLEDLLVREEYLHPHEMEDLERIKQQFEDLPELLAPALKGRYQELIIKYHR